MPGTALVRATFFVVGAVVGGGVATAITAFRKRQVTTSISAASPSSRVYSSKSAVPSAPGGLHAGDDSVLRYGNPGMFSNCVSVLMSLSMWRIGPVSDQLVRQAYTIGYDRRLRHPVWVRCGSSPGLVTTYGAH
jgi:endonuclease G, mitochondrial